MNLLFCLNCKSRSKRYVSPEEENSSVEQLIDENPVARTKQIDRELEGYKMHSEKTVKLLLLGTQNAGKSTILKQIKLIHGQAPEFEQRKLLVPLIHSQIVTSMQKLILDTLSGDELSDSEKRFVDVDPSCGIDHMTGIMMNKIWKQRCMSWRDEALFTNLHYFLSNLDRVLHQQYVPNFADLVYLRVPTVGVNVARIYVHDIPFEIYDVGGQQSERRKWVHFFDDVNAIIFVTALDEFDQLSTEKGHTMNCLMRSLGIFSEICQIESFYNIPLLIFFNKIDLFTEKIQKQDINSIPEFSSFSGEVKNATVAVRYFMYLFMKQNRITKRNLFCHATCGIHTQNIKHVFNLCVSDVLFKTLAEGGMLA
mmetsp:Transcript_20633/g.26756  ORF Transcript_20633/g.26756 Transcript_20633/m.26756 type:complete len:367 (+) Transcript_20633:61-1161(+)